MPAAAMLLAVLATASMAALAQRIPLQPPPYLIAHRGEAGELPEHTAEAYRRGMAQGASFVECDVVMTRDCQLICRHEPELIGTTNARALFPDRIKNYTIDATLSGTGILASDLTLAEVKTLYAIQRLPAIRDPNYDKFRVITLQEHIDIVKGNPDRIVGIYPESKHPVWHDSLNLTCMNGTFSQMILDVLVRNNYTGPINSPAWNAQPVFYQSFEVENLRDLKNRTNIPLVQLVDQPRLIIAGTNITYGSLLTPAGLDQVATYASGLGPAKDTIDVTNNGYVNQTTDLVAQVHARGMQIHPYTFRNEYQFMTFNYTSDIYNEYDHFFGELGLDGAFTDHPQTLHDYLLCQNYTRPVAGRNIFLPTISAGFRNGPVNATQALPHDRPWIIAHGGASGKLPGNTVPAFQQAINMGANFITCEIAVTRDQQLVCRASPNLYNNTNAINVTSISSRARTTQIAGQNATGVFVPDLTLAELQTVGAVQSAGPGRDPQYNGRYRVATLQDAISAARNASRTVGIYIQLVYPEFYNAIAVATNQTLVEDLVINQLTRNGYNASLCASTWNTQPVFISSDSQTSLQYVYNKSPVPLIQVLNNPANMTFANAAGYTDAALGAIATYAVGISPNKTLLVPNNGLNYTGQVSSLSQRAHARGLLVHPFLFRDENEYLLWTFGSDGHRELDFFATSVGIDGAITDYSGTMSTYLNCHFHQPSATQFQPVSLPPVCSSIPAPVVAYAPAAGLISAPATVAAAAPSATSASAGRRLAF